jgi:hypothetical protein
MIYALNNIEISDSKMNKAKIILGVVIPDIGGIILNAFPMILLLSLTNFFAGDTPDFPPLVVASVLLISLALFLIPFRLLLVATQLLKFELNEYGIFSVAIIGGLAGGSLFYFLILSRFYPNLSNVFVYALLGVIQSIIVQLIYRFIPDNWKIQPSE